VDEKYISDTLKIPVKKMENVEGRMENVGKNPKNLNFNSQFSILNSQLKKPLSYQEDQLLNTDLSDIKDELNIVYKIINECNSYEEALSKIEKFDNPKLEEALEKIIFANFFLGMLE